MTEQSERIATEQDHREHEVDEAAADTMAAEAAATAFGPQVQQQAWSIEGPDTEPAIEPQQHHRWSEVWMCVLALIVIGIVLAIAAATITTMTRGKSAGTPTPTTTTIVAAPPPPQPRVDSDADFDAAFRCVDGQLAWSIGYASYFGGIPHGVTVDEYGGQQPQLVLDSWRAGGVVVNCSRVYGQLQTLGITVVTAPSDHPQARRVRYFVTQTAQQSEALQAYFQNYYHNHYRGLPENGPAFSRGVAAMVANTGFCVQPDAQCERDY
jgi:hypothetical protein